MRTTLPSPASLSILACVSLIFAARLWLIGFAGNATPFWDEWDAGAASLFKPLVEHHLVFDNLFSPQNEHHVLFTRVLMLVLYWLVGSWDVVLQMLINAALQAVVVALIAARLARIVSASRRVVVLAAAAVLVALPFGWENTLLGFNTHFYLVIGFSVGCLACLVAAPAWSARWWLGIALALAASANMASGPMCLAAAAALGALQMLCRKRSGAREIAGLALLVLIAAALVAAVPQVEASAPFRAHSLGAFFSALLAIASWPFGASLGRVGMVIGLLIYLPSVALTIRVLRGSPPLSDPRWFNLLVLGWLVTQFVVLAYGRAEGPLASRYLDTYVLGSVVNVASLLHVLPQRWRLARGRGLEALGVIIVFAALVGVRLQTRPTAFGMDGVVMRRDTARIETDRVRGYLATHDPAFLDDTKLFDLPYPDPVRLRLLLDDPSIRAVLPSQLTTGQPETGALQEFKQGLMASWPGFAALGVVLFLLAGLRSARNEEQP
jgi:hypothetical protein